MATTFNPVPEYIGSLADLPIDVAEALYSPDFVELSSIGRTGTPLSLPMSFTLDIAGNEVRFSSPLSAARLVHYARDPRCSVLFSRVTAGYAPVLLQGVVALGEVAPGVARGPARRFTVTPRRVTVLDQQPRIWRLSAPPPAGSPVDGADSDGRTGAETPSRGRSTTIAPSSADLDALLSLPTTVATLRDGEGWPVALPVEPRRMDGLLTATLPDLGDGSPLSGRASLLGHTWSKEGPRYLALSGRGEITDGLFTFHPAAVLRRGI